MILIKLKHFRLVAHISLLLILEIFRTLLWYFFCWPWTGICLLGSNYLRKVFNCTFPAFHLVFLITLYYFPWTAYELWITFSEDFTQIQPGKKYWKIDHNLVAIYKDYIVHFVRQIYINVCSWIINQWDSLYEPAGLNLLSENSDLAVLNAIREFIQNAI